MLTDFRPSVRHSSKREGMISATESKKK